MEKLAQEHVDQKLAAYPEWSLIGDSMQRTFGFDDFVSAMAFVSRVADLAEEFQHHPDILIRYNKVTLTLSTHDAGGLTGKDFTLAGEIDALKKPKRRSAETS
ncbi:MAG: 4a-hydroxytetrahydrobiopterin dehydratase [Phycisphaerales bacterium]|nr:4a-hydroxytetrahydrobiopterin dehydratase [Phycisphaerales bacterium]MCI0674885.1 4a-hydroxytetrahydrobiopterin dehydratase [Phycisphaerales bacterium]